MQVIVNAAYSSAVRMYVSWVILGLAKRVQHVVVSFDPFFSFNILGIGSLLLDEYNACYASMGPLCFSSWMLCTDPF